MQSADDASRPFGFAGTDVFRRVLAGMPLGLLMIDAEGTIHYANGAAASILGGRTDELIGSTFNASAAEGTILEAWDIETGRRSVARQSEATLPGCPRTRIVMLTDETESMAPGEMREKARAAAEAIASLEDAAAAAIADLRGIPGSEPAAIRLQEAVGKSAAVVSEFFAMETDKQTWQEKHRGETAPAGRSGATPTARDGGESRRMLVVDDDGAVARITARALAVLGIEAIARDTVAEALSFLETDSVDTVLVDAMMPGPGIEQVCLKLRALQPEARIVVMSGADTVADRVRGLSDGFLAKPFSVAELRGLFDEKVGKRLRRAA